MKTAITEKIRIRREIGFAFTAFRIASPGYPSTESQLGDCVEEMLHAANMA
jgi:hypothetical protein